jgi:hypothetical protein
MSGQLHDPAALTAGKKNLAVPTGKQGWVGPRAGLEAVKSKYLSPSSQSNPARPAQWIPNFFWPPAARFHKLIPSASALPYRKHSSEQRFAQPTIYLSIYLRLYSPLLGLGRFFCFLSFLRNRQNSLDGGSARRKAATRTQDNTNTE